MRYFLIIVALVMVACNANQNQGHTHGPQGHSHQTSATATVDTTIWTDKTELFVEFPALVVNKTSRFAAHFTKLEKHRPVREGNVTVSLVKGNKGIRHKVDQPSSPGIFTPSLQPKEAGVYQLVFNLETPDFQDRIVIDKVTVFANSDEADNQLGGQDEPSGTISFLKEQAWKIDFQTSSVIEREIHDIIPSSGIWKAAPGAHKSLVANTSGVVVFAKKNLTEGISVKKGQLLATINSQELTANNLQAEIDKAKAAYEKAKATFERKKQLHESGIVAKSEFEQVENEYLIAKASYETLRSGYSSGGKQIRAPFDGFIKTIAVTNGAYAEEGNTLISLGTHQSRLLEIRVSPAYALSLESIHNIWYQPRSGEWSSINESGGSVLSIGKEVDGDEPLIPIYAQVNEAVQMPEGGFTEVQVAIGNTEKSLIVPETALLEDYGAYAVIVQLSGESFERRPVTPGRRNGQYVEIKQGLHAGEAVVTKGAYQVKMASMSGQTPAHGHAH
ncbi:efflux RND transporter periplasmic adaptor subunit [Fulvivirgaceae bacterium BMA10]|uniref:Efflux RND transporter periplasmic adaptor subunit n=1 Tax=Splendidivirga corallicola TaxID=3051826 RepID=A0ABT8KXH4_9BACT|nr:efflux RND transporter periplasmic adaptor subunit [Fulvivirgaceae bacterium BMA10]